MGSLPTGSDKILEIQSGNICVVIQNKDPHPILSNQRILQQTSELRVVGGNVCCVKIFGEDKVTAAERTAGATCYSIHTSPLFFEQTDYGITVKSTDGKAVSLWHKNYHVRNQISPVTDSEDLLSGIVNFGNSAGFSEFEIFHDGRKCLAVRIEVFPSKISCKEDYQDMPQDISNEIAGAVPDFMRATYREFSHGSTQDTAPEVFFEIIKRCFDKFLSAANRIIAAPHHKLCVEHPVVPAHKVRKIDKRTIAWLQKHPQAVVPTASGYCATKAPSVKKQITYNTAENRFAGFLLKSTVKELQDFRECYVRSARKPEDTVLSRVDSMTAALNKLINTTFLREADDYHDRKSMSLVLEMAPGYRELYKYYLMMQSGLSVHGDEFRMSLKDTAQLAGIDWNIRDVLVGSLGSVAQFDDNIRRKYYYVPAKYVDARNLPIHYIALYQSKNRFQEYAGIRYYGEVTYMKQVKRRDIDFPMTRNNADELYYGFRVKEWQTLPAPIAIRDEWVNEPKFTSLFLLEHSRYSFELFHIHSEEEYRLMAEIHKAFDDLSISAAGKDCAVYRISESHCVIVADGSFTVTNDNGDILGSISIRNYARNPLHGFRMLKRILGGQN